MTIDTDVLRSWAERSLAALRAGDEVRLAALRKEGQRLLAELDAPDEDPR